MSVSRSIIQVDQRNDPHACGTNVSALLGKDYFLCGIRCGAYRIRSESGFAPNQTTARSDKKRAGCARSWPRQGSEIEMDPVWRGGRRFASGTGGLSSGRALPRPGILPSTAGTVGKQKDYTSNGIAPITSELDPDAGTYVMRTL
jgi:hypothetical protein